MAPPSPAEVTLAGKLNVFVHQAFPVFRYGRSVAAGFSGAAAATGEAYGERENRRGFSVIGEEVSRATTVFIDARSAPGIGSWSERIFDNPAPESSAITGSPRGPRR